MTISSTVSRLSFAGNSSTTAFSVSFKFIDAADLVVYLDDALQVLDSDYTVTGGSGATGTVTFSSAPATGETVTIVRDVALLQETDYVANDPFPAEAHELALDRLTMIAQRNRDLLDRSLTLADSAGVDVSTQLPAPAANEVIAWNSTGTALVSKTVADISSAVIGANTIVDTFAGNGSAVDFTLSADPQTELNTLVFVGGVYQEKTEYSLTGTTITFSAAPPSGVNVQVIQQVSVTYPITALSDNVVTTEKIVDGAVTFAKTTGVQAADANTAKTNVKQSFTAQQRAMTGTLTDGATISWDADVKGQIVAVTLGGNRTMAAPTNIVQYSQYMVRVTQDVTGSRTLTWNAAYKFGTAGAPTLTTTAAKTDWLSFIGGSGNTLEFLGIKKDAV